MMIIAVSAVLAGAVCGDHISPISDTTVMSSAGAQSNHINHVTTQMQYAAVVAVVCIIGYIIAGLVQIWWVALGISLMLLLAVLTFIKRGRGATAKRQQVYKNQDRSPKTKKGAGEETCSFLVT